MVGQCQCQWCAFLPFDPLSRILFVCSHFENSFSRCAPALELPIRLALALALTPAASASLQLAWSAESSVLPLRPYAQPSRQAAQSITLRGPFRREDPLEGLTRHSPAGSFQRPEFRFGWSPPSNFTGTPLLLSCVWNIGARLHCSMPPLPRVPVWTKRPARDHGHGRTCSFLPTS